MTPNDTLVAFGSAVKSLGDDGRIGGYLISFGSSDRKDLSGQWFTPRTYYGAHGGNGMDVLVHHGVPLQSELAELAGRMLAPMTVKADDVGLWAETVLNLSDGYQKMIHDLVSEGHLGWSSGSASHMVRMTEEGEITCWPIIEGSLTPTPAEWRSTNTIVPLKSLIDSVASSSNGDVPEPQEQDVGEAPATTFPTVDSSTAEEETNEAPAIVSPESDSSASAEPVIPSSLALKASQVLSNENHFALKNARDLLDRVIRSHEEKVLSQADTVLIDAESSPPTKSADEKAAETPLPPLPIITWNDSMMDAFAKALT